MSQSHVPHCALPVALAGQPPPHSPSEHFASVHKTPVALTVSWLHDLSFPKPSSLPSPSSPDQVKCPQSHLIARLTL